ncbi:reverse transcriptase domain-containing protein [Tanacetum coccineum]|uniref:Reverse transcriptase domain-containing protein n=1 Tax=Tanacetum coccineum TaxID=301880 RepID=A0ABQ5H0L3_9ASTR
MLVTREGKEYTYALRFKFETTNNKAEYEALLGGLRIATDMKIKNLSIFVDSQLVANQVKGLFEARQHMIKQYLEKTNEFLRSFNSYTMEYVRRDQNKKVDALSKLASMTFSRLAKEVLVEVLSEKLIVQREVADIIKEEGENWMLPIREYLLFGLLPKDPQKARKLRVKAPQYRIIDGSLYRSRLVVSKIMKLGYYWPSMHIVAKSEIQRCEACQIHSYVPRKPKQDMTSITSVWPFSQWEIDIVGPLPIAPRGARYTEHQKSSNGETLFSLTYGLEVVVPIEISVKTEMIKEFEVRKNDKRHQEDLDILEERREIASIREAHYKQKLKRYYNKRVRPSTFKPGAYMLQLNSASKAEFQGKRDQHGNGPT